MGIEIEIEMFHLLKLVNQAPHCFRVTYLEAPEVVLGAAREGDCGRELCLLGLDGHPWLFLEKDSISLKTSTEVERKAGVQCKALRQLGCRDRGE